MGYFLCRDWGEGEDIILNKLKVRRNKIKY